jgi:hypothetical protein
MPVPNRVRSGQPTKSLRSAETFNYLLEAARAVHEDRGANFMPPAIGGGAAPGVILVKNTSGGTVDRFGVLGLGAALITPTANAVEFKNQIVLEGDTPVASGPFAVLLEPLLDDAIGRAVVAGAVQVQISVGEAGHTHARATTSTSYLQSGVCGTARILWKESGTGTKWAIVLLGQPARAAEIMLFTANETNKDGSGSTIAVTGGTVLAPADAEAPDPLPTSIANLFGWGYSSGSPVLAFYRPDTQAWLGVPAGVALSQAVDSLQLSDGKLQAKTHTGVKVLARAEDDPLFVDIGGDPDGTPVSVIVGLRLSGLTLQYQPRQVYVLKADTAGDWTTWHTGTDCPT